MAQLTNDFSVTFDNYSLGSIPNLTLVRRFPNSLPRMVIETEDIVRRDGQIVVSRRYQNKAIVIEAIILAPSRQAYEETMDELKYRLSPTERPLRLTQAGNSRYYTATLRSLSEDFIEAGKAQVTIEFQASNPFGRDGTTTVEQYVNTLASYNFTTTFAGSSRVYPVFRATLTAVTGGTAKTMLFGNSDTGQFVSITRDWVANDTVYINTENGDVSVNGLPEEYTGVLPYFEARSNAAYYTDDFTTRTVTLRLEYVKQYL